MSAIVTSDTLGLVGHSLPLPNDATGPNAGRSGEQLAVNLVNGNLVLQRQDEFLVGKGLDTAVLRTYNSQGLSDGDNNDNWRIGFYRQIKALTGTINTAGSTVTRVDADGAECVYKFNGSLYVNTDGGGSYDTLSYSSANSQWTWTDGDSRMTETYDWTNGAGKLLNQKDIDGYILSYTYQANGLLQEVANASGEKTLLVYNSTNLARVSTVLTNGTTSTTSSRVSYAYDGSNRLQTVTVDLTPANTQDNLVYTTTYTYDGASKRVATVAQSDGSAISISYDASNRVSRITDALGNLTIYKYEANKTTITDALGNNTVHEYDANNRLIRIADPAVNGVASGQQFSYNANGDIITITDGEGRRVFMQYDATGNQTLQRDEAGNTVTRTFNSNNQILTETVYVTRDPDGADPTHVNAAGAPGAPLTIRYVYDAFGRLRFVISAEGRVTEHQYNAAGQRSRTLEYLAGVHTAASATETDLNTWATAVNKAQTQRTDMEYDFRGQLSKSTTYSTVDSAGNASGAAVTTYVYDQAGRLLSTIAPIGGSAQTTSYTYDGLDRLLVTTNGLGQQTVYSYDDAGNSITLTAANGLKNISTYDKAGRLVSLQQRDAANADLGTTRYYYDNDHQLRMTEDATGVRTWMLYDAAGQKNGEIDGNGTLTEYVYDRNGQVTQTIRYATPVRAMLSPVMNIEIFSSGYSNSLAAMGLTDSVNGSAVIAGSFTTSTFTAENVRRVRSLDVADPNLFALRFTGSITVFAADNYTFYTKSDDGSNLYIDGQLLVNNDGLHGVARASQSVFLTEGTHSLVETYFDCYYGNTNEFGLSIGTADYSVEQMVQIERLRPTANVEDQRSWNVYDAANHLAKQVAANGAVTEFQYDGLSRMVRTIEYANTINTASLGSAPTAAAIAPVADPQNDRVSRNFYDNDGLLRATLDGEGYLVENSYNNQGNLWKSAAYATPTTGSLRANGTLNDLRPAGSADDIVSYTLYDAERDVVADIDGEGYLTEYSYDANGNRIQTRSYATPVAAAVLSGITATTTLASVRPAVNTVDQIQSATYDALNRIVTSTDAQGAVTFRAYDAVGNMTSITVAHGTAEARTESITYDLAGRLTVSTDARGNTTLQSYDKADRLVRSTDENGNITRYYYNEEDQLVYTINALGEVSGNSYNALGQLITGTRYGTRVVGTTLTNLQGGLVDTTINAAITAITNNAFDSKTNYAYNTDGTLKSSSDALGNLTLYDYNAFGEQKSITIPIATGNTLTSTFAYDRRGLTLSTTADPSGINATGSQVYDAFGRVVQSTDARGNISTIKYDRLGRQVRITDALGSVQSTTYDAFDRVLTQTDARGNVTTTSYDSATRTTSITTPDNVTVRTSYNRHEQVVSVVDGRGNTITYTYDANGNLTQTDLPLQRSGRQVFDKANRLTESVDERGILTVLEYDAADRVLTRTVDPSTTSPAYTGLNLVTRYEHDALGRQTKTTDPNGVITVTEYDLNGQVTRQIADAGTGKLNLTTVTTYDQRGKTLTVTDAGGTVTRYTYDKLGRRIEEMVDPTGLALKTSYSYDNNDNVISKTVSNPGGDSITRYAYDAEDRLVYSVDPVGAVTKYEYDANGNVVRKTAYANTIQATTQPSSVVADATGDVITRSIYDATNRLTHTVDGMGTVTKYEYDANGNVLQKTAYATLPMENVDMVKRFAATNDQETFALRSTVSFTVAIAGTYTFYTNSDDGSRLYINGTEIINNDALQGPTRKTGSIALSAGTHTLVQTYFDQGGAQLNQFGVDTGPSGTNATSNFGISFGQMNIEVFNYTGSYSSLNASGTGSLGLNNSGVGSVLSLVGSVTAVVTDAGQLGRSVVLDPASDQVTRYTHDAANRVQYMVDPTGAVTKYDYNANGNVASKTAYADAIPTSNSLKISYTTGKANTAWRSSVTVNAGETITMTLRFKTDAKSAAQIYIGTHSGLMMGNGDWQTLTVTRTITSNEVLPSYIDVADLDGASHPNGGYALFDDLVITSNQRGVIFTDSFNTISPWSQAFWGNGSLEHINVANTNDTMANALRVDPARDQTTRNVHDAADRLQYMVDGTGAVTKYDYDANGNVLKKTAYANPIAAAALASSVVADPARDQVTQYTYDAANRQIRTTYPTVGIYSGESTTALLANGATGTASRVETSSSLYTQAYYDASGNIVANRDAAGNMRYQAYDAAGQMRYAVDAEGYVTGYVRDAMGNVTALTRYTDKIADATRTTWGEATPSLTTISALLTNNSANRTITTEYDASGRAVQVTEPSVYAHDGTNAFTSSPVTRHTYNALGQIVQTQVKKDNTSWISTYRYYDQRGLEIAAIDALRNVTTQRYDAFGNVTERTEYANPLANTVSINATAYTLPGASDKDRTTGFTFDQNNRRVSETQVNVEYSAGASGNGVTLYADASYQGSSKSFGAGLYNAGGLGIGNEALSSIKVASGWQVTLYEHADFQGKTRVITADSASLPDFNDKTSSIAITGSVRGNLTSTYQYDAFGNLIRSTDAGNNSTTTYYDQAGRTRAVMQATRAIEGNASFSGLTEFTRDAFGNVKQQVERANGAGNISLNSYTTSSNSNDRINSVKYDSWGRAIETTDALGNVQYMSYDANGNVAKQWQAVDSGDGLIRTSFKSFRYDRLGQLVNTIEPGSYGVSIFSDSNYQGSSRAFTVGDYNLSQLGIGNDVLSALSVKQGWTVTLYADSNFTGATRTITSNTASLPEFNDQTSSLRITAAGNLAVNNTQMRYNAFGELVSKGLVGNDVMWPGDLRADQSIVSANGRYQLVMQPDGNLVTYDLQNNRKAMWNAGTLNNSGARFSFQGSDGNLVIYKSDGTGLWNAGTQNDAESKNGFLRLQNDGNLVLYNASGSRAIWSSGVGDIMRPGNLLANQSIVSANGRYQLIMQPDGNLVIYDLQNNGQAIWNTATFSNSGARFSFQANDGNLVIYNANGTAIWNAGSQNDAASKNGFLRLQNDGNLVLCTANGSRAIWNSRTGLNVSSVNIQALVNLQGEAQSEYFDYNNGGQLWRSNSGDGVSKVMLYDLQGNQTMELRSASEDLKTRADASAVLAMAGTRQTRNVYDALGRQVRQVLANGATVYQERDRWGNVLSVNDARDANWKTEYLYDANNQVIRETRPMASLFNGTDYSNTRPVTQYFHDYAGMQVAVRDARGNVNQTVYDAAGNVVSEIHADGGLVSHAYNAFGNEARQTDALGNVTRHEYDKLGRLTKIIRPSDNVTFHKIGQLDAWSDEDAPVALYNDANYSGAVTYFGIGDYKDLGPLAFNSIMVKSGWKVELFDDDSAGSVNNASYTSNVSDVPYDLEDDISWLKVSRIDGVTAAATVVADGSTSDIVITYDALGRQLSRTDGSGQTRYEYDIGGNVVRMIRPGSVVTANQYDFQGRKLSETNANGDFLSWQYDYFGRSTGRRDIGGASYTFGYDLAGQLKTENNTRGRDVRTSYNAAGQVSEIRSSVIKTGSLTVAESITTYGYDLAGNRTSEKTVINGTTYADNTIRYNALGQMEYAGKPLEDIYFNYDAAGNRTKSSQYFGSWVYRHYAYDSMNRMILADGDIDNNPENTSNLVSGHKITYDKNGNRISGQYKQSVTESYGYDGLGRLTTVWNGGIDTGTKRRDIKYDKADRIIQSFDNMTGNSIDAQNYTNVYDDKGRLARQYFSSSMSVDRSAVFNTYDNMGNLTKTVNQIFDQGGFMSRERTTYSRIGDSYKQSGIEGDRKGHSGDAWSASKSTSLHYDVNGYLLGVTDSGEVKNNRTFVNDAQGQILQKTQEGNVLKNLVINGQVLGTYGKGVDTGATPAVSRVTIKVTLNVLAQDDEIGDSSEFRLKFTLKDRDSLYEMVSRNEDDTSDFFEYENIVGDSDQVEGAKSQMTYVFKNVQWPPIGMLDISVEGYEHDGSANDPIVQATYGLDPKSWNKEGQVFLHGTTFTNGDLSYQFMFQITSEASDPKSSDQVYDFSAFQKIDGAHPGSGPGTHRVNAGDTLQSIAQGAYGDAALWYLIADANGLGANSSLQAGTMLTLPSNVGTVHNNTSTFKPYEVGRMIGNTSPTVPTPEGNKCAAIGFTILSILAAVVVSVLVTALTGGAGAGLGVALMAGAIGGALGSVASQGVMLLSRQQQDFSWTDVAVGAAVGLVGGGLGGYAAGAGKALAGAGKTLSLGQKIMTASLSGAKSVKGAALLFAKVTTYAAASAAQNALGQGIKIAIDGGKFDWKSVAISAASGATASIGDELAGAMGEKITEVGKKFSKMAANASSKVGPALQFMGRTAANAALGATREMASNAVEQGYEKAIDPEQYSEFDFTRLAFAAVEGASGNLGDTFADEKEEDFTRFRQEIPGMLRIGFNKSKSIASDLMLRTSNNVSDLRTTAGVQLVRGKTTTKAALEVAKQMATSAANYVVNGAKESVSWLKRSGSIAINAAREAATSAANYVADGASTAGSAQLVMGRTATNAAIGMATRAVSDAASGKSPAASAGAFKVIAVKSRAASSPAWVLSQTPPSP
jgi:YD repeat-containing protein